MDVYVMDGVFLHELRETSMGVGPRACHGRRLESCKGPVVND